MYALWLSYHSNTEAVLFACLSSGWATTTGRLLGPKFGNSIKGELGKLQFYFRKIPLHEQKFLVVSVLSNWPWLQRNLKNGPK